MDSFFRKYLPKILLILIPIGVIFHFFGRMLKCPACYLFEDAGDALKNYFNLAYFVEHDKGIWFSGMNYPYGDHILFTDNQPIIALVLNFIHNHIMDLSAHTVGIPNTLLIISLFLSCLVLYQVLRFFALNRYASVIFACLITFLSPQIFRYTGHFSLAYGFYFPLFLLLFLRFLKGPRKKLYGTFLVLWITWIGMTHLYHFLMAEAFLASYFVFSIGKGMLSGKKKNARNKVRFTDRFKSALSWEFLFVLIIPAVLLLGFMKVTDPITDRPTQPWRHDGLNATFSGTFTPTFAPFQNFWKENFDIKEMDLEAKSYVGLVGLLMIPFALGFLLRKRRQRRVRTRAPAEMLHSSLLSSIFVWLIAAGILYSGLFDFLLDWIPKLKQFRGLGRLSWVFYYVYTIFISFYLYRAFRWLRLKKWKWVGGILIVIFISFWAVESYYHMKPVFTNLYKKNQYLNHKDHSYTEFLKSHGKAPSEFQSILALPMIAVGSETVGISRGLWTMREGVRSAYDTDLPLMDFSLSRTSVSQTMDLMQLLSDISIPKKRLGNMSSKPILLICEEKLMTPAERKLVQYADLIGKLRTMTIYSLDPDKLHQPDSSSAIDFNPSTASATRIEEGGQFIHRYTSSTDTIRNYSVQLWSKIDNMEAQLPVLRIKRTAPDGQVRDDGGIHRDRVDWSEVIDDWVRLDWQFESPGADYQFDFYIDSKNSIVDRIIIIPEAR